MNIIETVKRKITSTGRNRGIKITIPRRFADKIHWDAGDNINVSLVVEDEDYDRGYLILKKE